MLYLLSFLDRVNISQARLDGLEKDLGLTGNQFQIALLVFFVSDVCKIISGGPPARVKTSRSAVSVPQLWSSCYDVADPRVDALHGQVGYVVTEIPSNIALKHLKPSRFIPAVMLVWVRPGLPTRQPPSVRPVRLGPACAVTVLTVRHTTCWPHRVSS